VPARGAHGPADSDPGADTATLRALDEALFEPGRWFAIDADNNRLRGVTPGTLGDALALVGRGCVATVAGTLRPEVRVVDVDVSGERGVLATRTITDWCRDRGLWHLVRPSGGARGRAHVFVVPGVHRGDLLAHVAALRAEVRTSKVGLDLRRTVRPLSAPHRRTGAPA
jgi:hypothetical protein